MGVWDTLIGLAATALKEHPRREILEALLELRSKMVACQKTYADYQEVCKEGDYETVMKKRGNLPRPEGIAGAFLYEPREEWEQIVRELAMMLHRIDPTLTILSPDASNVVQDYFRSEASVTLWPKMFYETMLNSLGAEVDSGEAAPDVQCKPAVDKLDEFIRQNFKPEEVFSAQKEIEVWPSPYRFCGEYWLTLE